MNTNPTIPMLIVGAGPSGLVLALILRQNGIPVRIIEKEERVRVGQRGAAIMPRSLELYNSLGILSDILAKASPIVPMRIYKLPRGVEPIKTFSLDPPVQPTPAKPYSNLVMLGQEIVEAILRSHLAKYDCYVEQRTMLHGLETRPDFVIAHVTRSENGKETDFAITSRWLIGTDGARGEVRKQLGMTFRGISRGVEEHLVVGDLEVRGLDHDYWHSWGDMNTILVMLRPTEVDGMYFMFIGGHVNHAKMVEEREEFLKAFRAGTGRDDLEVGEIRTLAEYKPHERMVDEFSSGRVFLAGDAAHIHSPFGGQGLNSSVQDSANLAWKLALVEKGIANPSLLATYTEERAPVIAQMLKTSHKLYNEAIEAKQDGSTSEKAWQRGGYLNQLGINYRWSPIVVDDRYPREEQPEDPYGVNRHDSDIVRAGERAPDAPGLVVLRRSSSDQVEERNTTSLFSIFSLIYHTVLFFCKDIEEVGPILSVLRSYPASTFRSTIILPSGTHVDDIDGVEYILADEDGHAYASYAVSSGSFAIVAVRPDGIVGGIMFSSQSLKQYLNGIFSAIAI